MKLLRQNSGIIEEVEVNTSGATTIQTTVVFANEENYVETTVNNVAILSTSKIICSFVGDEEIAIQAITCGVKSVSEGSCIVFAGTPYGATGTYSINLLIG